MALEALSTNELFNLIIYDTFSATPLCHNNNNNHNVSETTPFAAVGPTPPPQQEFCGGGDGGGLDALPAWRRHSVVAETTTTTTTTTTTRQQNLAVQGGCRKKRRRRPKICKNKEEAETQRITHIAVERNRRKQMNEHLAVLRSLMPESYVQRGDQASIVGGAIEFVKELEHLLQSLESRKFQLLHGGVGGGDGGGATSDNGGGGEFLGNPFSQFFSYPQYTCSPNKYTSKSKAAIADIEVTLIETHANVKILSRRRFRQLSKIIAAFHTICLSILHLNVTTLDPLVLYSISAKVEEGCQLNSADEIAGAVHHMLRIIEEEDI